MNARVPNLNRRQFIVGSSAITSGLAIGLQFPLSMSPAEAAAAKPAATPEIGAWVVIQPNDTVVIRVVRSEMGQGTITGLAQLVAEELGCDWKKVTYEYAELKQKAYETYKEWEPDVFLVEAKAAGSPLIFELRRMGIPVSEYSPTKGNDKVVRLNAVSDLFASGRIWVPERKFADDLIEEVAAFPAGEHDDQVVS